MLLQEDDRAWLASSTLPRLPWRRTIEDAMPPLFCLLLAATLTAQPPAPGPLPAAVPRSPDPEWKPLGRDLWFDPMLKRLIIRARVVLREGPLEHLLCLKGTKEHEAILATESQPRQIHAGLLLTGAEPGHPVLFLPRFGLPSAPPIGVDITWLVLNEPPFMQVGPTGDPIEIDLLWSQGGLEKRTAGQRWVKDERSGRPLTEHWVFAGSLLYTDPVTRKTIYAADEGDLITVANFASSILDLPLASSASNAERLFVADPRQVPPLGTEVLMILRPAEKPAARGP